MSDQLFRYMDDRSRRFYARIFNTAVMNLYAVRNGMYPTLMCETDDPRFMLHWRAAVPGIIARMEARRQNGY